MLESLARAAIAWSVRPRSVRAPGAELLALARQVRRHVAGGGEVECLERGLRAVIEKADHRKLGGTAQLLDAGQAVGDLVAQQRVGLIQEIDRDHPVRQAPHDRHRPGRCRRQGPCNSP